MRVFLFAVVASGETLVRIETRANGAATMTPEAPRCDVCVQFMGIDFFSTVNCCIGDGDAFYKTHIIEVPLDGAVGGAFHSKSAGELLPGDVVAYEARGPSGGLVPGGAYVVVSVDAAQGRVELAAHGETPPLTVDPSERVKGVLRLELEREYVVGPSTLEDIKDTTIKVDIGFITDVHSATAKRAENEGRRTPGCVESDTPTCHALGFTLFKEAQAKRADSAKESARNEADKAARKTRKCACELSSDGHCRAQAGYNGRCVQKCITVDSCTHGRDRAQVPPASLPAARAELCRAFNENPTKPPCEWPLQAQAATEDQSGQSGQ